MKWRSWRGWVAIRNPRRDDARDAMVMEECGFKVTRNPSEMAKLLKALL